MDINEYSGNAEDSQRTALHSACAQSRLDVVKLLISRGAKINAPAVKEGTALDCVVGLFQIQYDDRENIQNLIRYLLDNGAFVTCSGNSSSCSGNHDWRSALDSAIRYKEKDVIKLLLDHGAAFCSSSLRIAVESGDEELVQQVIDSGVDVNAGPSPLWQRIDKSRKSIIKILLDAGVDVNAQQDEGYNYGCPLGYAIEYEDLQLVGQLIDLGANVNGKVGVFGSPLARAAQNGNMEIISLLIRNGADLNASTHDLRSPLRAAVGSTNESMIRLLLDAGADVNVDDGYPLVLACIRGKIHIVKMLIEAGAQLHIQRGVAEYALQSAAEWAHKDICQLLIEKGANVNAQGGHGGNPLRAALANIHTCRTDRAPSIVRYLLSVGADVNAPPSGKYVSTLQAALSNGHGNSMEKLIQAGADINAHDPELGTALTASVRFAHSRWTNRLLDLGADPFLTGGDCGSALHAAVRVGMAEVVHRLLDVGMDVNFAAGKFGNVIQAACAPLGDVDYLSCVRLLLQRGANPNSRGGKYGTAIQCAAKHGKLAGVRLLLEYGADPTLRGGKYDNPVEAARMKKHWHIANYLKRYIRKNFPDYAQSQLVTDNELKHQFDGQDGLNGHVIKSTV